VREAVDNSALVSALLRIAKLVLAAESECTVFSLQIDFAQISTMPRSASRANNKVKKNRMSNNGI